MSDQESSSDEDMKSTKPHGKGLRGLAARYPNLFVFAVIFGLLGAVIAMQTCR